MNGRNFILDTNTIVALLKGDSGIEELLSNAEWIGISIISYLEFLAFPGLTVDDKLIFDEFTKRIEIIGIDITNQALLDNAIKFRTEYRIKLPDAIIASTAFVNNSRLITEDKQLGIISEINILGFR